MRRRRRDTARQSTRGPARPGCRGPRPRPSARCAASELVAPVSTSAPSIPAFAAAARSVSTRSPTSSARPGPRRSSAAWTIARRRLADVLRDDARGRLDRRHDGAAARPRAVGHGEEGVAPRGHDGRAPHRGLRRLAQLGVVEAVVRADDHDLRARGERRVVHDPQPRLLHVAVQRRRADDDGRGAVVAVALGEVELHRAADRHDLLDRGLEAEAPELADLLLGAVAPVVGDERDALARHAQRGQRLGRALGRLVADPEAAVEVEQEMVVAAGERGERHGRRPGASTRRARPGPSPGPPSGGVCRGAP